MVEEAYVSFETAKLLKEKGFPQSTFRCHYITDGNSHYKSFENRCGFGDFDIIAPTQQLAMKWLREVHNLSVEVYRTACGYVGCIVAIPSGTDIKFLEEDGDDLPSGQYTTYEKACEAAIWYCINNLI